jgi:5-methyltetrahydrofolate--homocysteine methyltransferase
MPLDLKIYASRVRLTDGVYGTEFQKLGLPAGTCLEMLNLERPAAVEAIARSYVQAGSDVIMTNTLMAHRFGLSSHGLANRAAQIARAGAQIACRAAAAAATKVFGSFGPSGKIVMMGEVSEAELADAFAETAGALTAGGAEAIVLETFNDLAEARIALQAVKSVCNLPVIVSLAFAFGPDKTATMMGDTPADLAAMAKANGADAIGANCGIGPDVAVRLAEMLRAASDLPIWIKPNAGLPVVKDGKTAFPMGPEEFASFIPAIISAGANFIGGCCGCGPKHIQAACRAAAVI